jgi:hypothetical protein
MTYARSATRPLVTGIIRALSGSAATDYWARHESTFRLPTSPWQGYPGCYEMPQLVKLV